jgi:hypothetical protein
VSDKVFNEWLARLEEGITYFHIHKTNEWLEQIKTSRNKLSELYEKQQKEIEQLEVRLNLTKTLTKFINTENPFTPSYKVKTSCDCIDWRDMSPSPFCHKCNGKGYY